MGLTTYDDEFLLAAIVIISMALIFYSVGVWSERIQGRLKGWHVTAFGLGLVCDFVGTAFMAELVRLTRRRSRRAKQFELPALDIQPDIVKLNVFKLREQFGIINIFFYKIN